MRTRSIFTARLGKSLLKHPDLLLLLGCFTVAMSHTNFNLPWLGWMSLVPFLVYLKFDQRRFKWLKFISALVLAWSLVVAKIITDPIPFFMVPMYSIPIAAFHLPAYVLWAQQRLNVYNFLLFPVVMVLLEWVQYTFTPLGSWGSMGYSQEGFTSMLQILSLFGLAGLSFLIYLINTILAALILKESSAQVWKYIGLVAVVLAVVYGELRLEHYKMSGREVIKVAAVGTDSEAGGLPIPTQDRNEIDLFTNLRRSKIAADAGAEVITWTEASFITQPHYVDDFLDTIRKWANEAKVTLVAGYINVTSEEPFHYENKYLVANGQGGEFFEGHKLQPVPGEPAESNLGYPRTVPVGNAKLSAAICYDYDFPKIAALHEDIEADIVALPSSDWRGIDPLHTEMAAFRAIEQGHSILRATRFGLSAAINPVGVLTHTMSDFATGDKVMIAELPKRATWTIYSNLKDLVVYLSFGYLLLLSVKVIRKK